jgi:hypothetical protein
LSTAHVIIFNMLLAYTLAVLILGTRRISDELSDKDVKNNVGRHCVVVSRYLVVLMSVGAIAVLPTTVWHHVPSLFTNLGIVVFAAAFIPLTIGALVMPPIVRGT